MSNTRSLSRRFPNAGQAWHDAVAQTCAPLAMTQRDARPKTSPVQALYTQSLAAITFLELTSDAGQVIANTHSSAGFIFAVLQLEGQCHAAHSAKNTVIRPQTFALFDTVEPFTLRFDRGGHARRWRALLLRIPHDLIAPLLMGAYRPGAVIHDGNAGGIDTIAVTTMLSTWSNIDYLEQRTCNAAEAAVISVLVAAARGAGRHDDANALRLRVDSYLASNLRTADLSAAAVAKRFAISLRKLHQLYAGTGRSFTQTVMALRVENCAREIAAADSQLSLTPIPFS